MKVTDHDIILLSMKHNINVDVTPFARDILRLAEGDRSVLPTVHYAEVVKRHMVSELFDKVYSNLADKKRGE